LVTAVVTHLVNKYKRMTESGVKYIDDKTTGSQACVCVCASIAVTRSLCHFHDD